LVRPVTVHELAPVVEQVLAPGLDVTVNLVMAEPSLNGAVHETVADLLAAVAFTPVGASGTVEGTTALESTEAAPVPSALVAVTVKV
jgi:hypothetical protein